MYHVRDAESIINEFARQQEKNILEGLNDLVSRGVLVIERGPVQLFHDQTANRIQIAAPVTLKLNDEEYIEKLERENVDLRAKLKSFQDAVKGIAND